MSKQVPRIGFLFLLAALGAVWLWHPSVIGSSNEELEAFFRTSLLGVLGFVISVTIASCTSLHLKLSELEKQGRGPFSGTKSKIRKSAFSLIFLFGAAFIALILKGAYAEGGERWDAFWNGFFITLLYFFISVLLDIARTSFKATEVS